MSSSGPSPIILWVLHYADTFGLFSQHSYFVFNIWYHALRSALIGFVTEKNKIKSFIFGSSKLSSVSCIHFFYSYWKPTHCNRNYIYVEYINYTLIYKKIYYNSRIYILIISFRAIFIIKIKQWKKFCLNFLNTHTCRFKNYRVSDA